ncbi:thiamine phosphate synthase [Leuconostoc pseudomesenteroides]|jgi:thiamine-phosphate pyrophosphorylase|uniref:Thiamine-phosphate synthase n=1 Tax=Leuconostoc falkenbergense TaxID=2766470 RepID=A0ABT7S0L6_9LACO|nr:thiamine phosphate synthase [Leuconostoc falkenbergense]RDG19111.1 thiamine phosphate synthase [Leuconostoc pseudomesenteroides]MCT4410748.1 thiamine phosphate synthase [Leuconostoc falkenbergense]MDM7647117.1 thiamine phosphate synthase [Leuconostoc falkenbergense]MDV3544742.1 thiamine phosphate synthase [Leuconostoc falkenbergense]VTU67884.1 thiamine-phosphate pyrophosphorylase [Lactobacillus ginsenosidimutans] [Leuconostoc pseudomesenteroides]
MNLKKTLKLYLVTDRQGLCDEEFLNRVGLACKSGVTLVQLREKELSSRDYFNLAVKVKLITDKYDIPLIIDDRLDICQAVGADGVHVGDTDLPINVVRKLLGPNKVIGVSAKSVQSAQEAEKQGADYIGVGAIYPTQTKVVTQHTSIKTLREISQNVSIPVIAIGGIKEAKIRNLTETGIVGVAMVSEIMKAINIAQKVPNLLKELHKVVTKE